MATAAIVSSLDCDGVWFCPPTTELSAPDRHQSPPPRTPAPSLLLLTRRRLTSWLEWLWRQEGSPGQRARGLAAGVFMGCFPFFGLQIILSVALASVVRGNHLLAAAGTWVSNPFTYLPLYWFNYQLGCLLIGPGRGWPGVEELRGGGIWNLGGDFALRLLLGSAAVGLAAATAAGLICWRWLRNGGGPAGKEPLRNS